MGDVVAVRDLADPRLRDYVGLTDVDLRRRFEPEHGMFIAEGDKVIRRAVGAGYTVRSFLVTRKWLDLLADVAGTTEAPVLLADDRLVEQVTGFRVHRGALAAMLRKPLPDPGAVLAAAQRIVVLEDVNDPENVGAVFRSAGALGIDAVLLSPRCGDPLYRRAVKVSMGAVFSVPYARLTEWYDAVALLRASGFATLALTPADGAIPIERVPPRLRERCALLLGSEGTGLTQRWLTEADAAVRIPMTRDIDSLNVAAATAVACWELGRPGSGARSV